MRALALAFAVALGASSAVACSLPSGAEQMRANAGAQMNAQRAAAGRAALSRDSRLDSAAQDHACWMGETNTFSHTGAGGSSHSQRIRAAGYQTRLAAENIAFGQTSGAAVIATWMGSSGHKANILRRGVDEYGVGVAMMQGRPVWVMVFAAN